MRVAPGSAGQSTARAGEKVPTITMRSQPFARTLTASGLEPSNLIAFPWRAWEAYELKRDAANNNKESRHAETNRYTRSR
jgi:hypothetical protein